MNMGYNMDTRLLTQLEGLKSVRTTVSKRQQNQTWKLTLVRLIAVVDETVGTATNQTKLAK